MAKGELLSTTETKVMLTLLKVGLELSEVFERRYAPNHVDKLRLRERRTYFRQKLTELNWGGVISDLEI